jgi:hypothetical protein
MLSENYEQKRKKAGVFYPGLGFGKFRLAYRPAKAELPPELAPSADLHQAFNLFFAPLEGLLRKATEGRGNCQNGAAELFSCQGL